MGNATLGDTTTPGTTYHASATGPVTIWPSGAYTGTSTEEMYIDGAYGFCGAADVPHNFTMGVYGSSGALIGGQSSTNQYGVGYGWNGGFWSGGSLVHITGASQQLLVGVYCDGFMQWSSNNDSNQYREYQHSGFPNNWSGVGSIDGQGHIGIFHTYITYWKRCAISSVDAGPFGIGQTFNVNGQSFNSGVSSVTLNGTNCPTYTVNSDSNIVVTVPSGATTGTVTVNTNAGSGTSGSNVTISNIWINTGTSGSPIWTPAAFYSNIGTAGSPNWSQANQVATNTGTAGSPTWTVGG